MGSTKDTTPRDECYEHSTTWRVYNPTGTNLNGWTPEVEAIELLPNASATSGTDVTGSVTFTYVSCPTCVTPSSGYNLPANGSTTNTRPLTIRFRLDASATGAGIYRVRFRWRNASGTLQPQLSLGGLYTDKVFLAPIPPTRPTNLRGVATCSGHGITWRTVAGADAYQVQRRYGTSGSFTSLTPVTTSNTQIYSNPSPPTTIIQYRVRAIKIHNPSCASPSVLYSTPSSVTTIDLTSASDITVTVNTGVQGTTVVFGGGGISTHSGVTNSSGVYSYDVPCNWSGQIGVAKSCYDFSTPNPRNVGPVSSATTVNFTGSLRTYTISGNVGVAGATVSLSGSGGSTTSNSSGDYSLTVDCGYSGVLSVSHSCHDFSPNSVTLSNVTANETRNFTASAAYPPSPVCLVGGNSATSPQQLTTLEPTLNWSIVASSAVEYELNIVEVSTNTVVHAASPLTGTTYTVPGGTLASNNVYAVVIRARYAGCGHPFSTSLCLKYIKTPYIEVTTPNSSTVWQKGNAETIFWNTNLTGDVRIELFKGGVFQQELFTVTANDGTELWPQIPFHIAAGTDYQIKITSLANLQVWDMSDFFTIEDIDCNASGVMIGYTGADAELQTAVCYLIQKGVLNLGQDYTTNENDIWREHLAKMAFVALFDGDWNPSLPSDAFYSRYTDLNEQTGDTYSERMHRKFARTLTFLEYDDARVAFNRDFDQFYGPESIKRKHVLKVIFEAFNITPGSDTDPSVFPWDPSVASGTDEYGYINKAGELGIETPVSGTGFRPNDNATRNEVIRWIYRAMTSMVSEINLPQARTDAQTLDAYYQPSYYDENNLNYAAASDPSVMNESFTCLSYKSKMSAAIGFQYSSARLDDQMLSLYPQHLTGFTRGWTHNYAMYIRELSDINVAGSQMRWPRNYLALVRPSGVTFWEDPNNPTPVSLGVYDELIKVSSTEYRLITHSKDTLVFQQLGGGTAPFLLKQIINRFGASTLLIYENATPISGISYTPKRLRTVSTAGIFPSRSFEIVYEPSTNKILRFEQKAGNTVLRQVSFDYYDHTLGTGVASDGLPDLKTFVNANGDPTVFDYASTDTPANITGDADRDHNLTQITLPNGNHVTAHYKYNKLQSKQTNQAGFANISVTASGLNTDVSVSMAGSAAMPSLPQRDYSIERNNNGLPIRMTGNGQDRQIWYDDPAHPTLPTKVRDHNIIYEMDYDAQGNVIVKRTKNTTTTDVLTETYEYNSRNDVTRYVSSEGHATLYEYNAAGALLRAYPDMAGGVLYSSTLTVNSWGGVDVARDPMGREVHFTYDSHGQVIRVNTMLGESHAAYDGMGRVAATWASDPNESTTRTMTYTYDNLDNITRQVTNGTGLPSPRELLFNYDNNSNLTTITNPKGENTNLTYNSDLDILENVSYGSFSRTYEHYADGKLWKVTKPDGLTVLLNEYDADGRLERFRRQGGDTYYQATYGTANNPNLLTEIQNTQYGRITYGYDHFNRLIWVEDNAGKRVEYTYTNDGLLSTMRLPKNGGGYFDIVYHYTNDARRWLERIEINKPTGGVEEIRMSYHRDASIRRIQYPNDVRTIFLYDDDGRLEGKFTNKYSGASIVARIESETYVWNDHNEITEAHRIPALPGSAAAASNTTWTYAPHNILQTVNGSPVSVDANGRKTAYRGEHYSYDDVDMLRRVDFTNGEHMTNVFGPDGSRRRVYRSDGNETINYLWAKGNIVGEYDGAGFNNYYIHGLGLMARVKPNGDIHYYHSDVRGSIKAMTDNTGAVTHSYAYNSDGFGEVTAINELAGDPNPFRYNGAYGVMHDYEAAGANQKQGSLYYMRARHMHTDMGRFLTEDPVFNATNLYPYADNQPICSCESNSRFSNVVNLGSKASSMTMVSGNSVMNELPFDTSVRRQGTTSGSSHQQSSYSPVLVGESSSSQGGTISALRGAIELANKGAVTNFADIVTLDFSNIGAGAFKVDGLGALGLVHDIATVLEHIDNDDYLEAGISTLEAIPTAGDAVYFSQCGWRKNCIDEGIEMHRAMYELANQYDAVGAGVDMWDGIFEFFGWK